MNIPIILSIIIILIVISTIFMYLIGSSHLNNNNNNNTQLESSYIKGFESKLGNSDDKIPDKSSAKSPPDKSSAKSPPDKIPDKIPDKSPDKSTNKSPDNKTSDTKGDSTINNILDTTKGIFTDPALYAAIGIDVVLREIIKKSVDKISKKVMAKLAYKAEELFLKTTAKVLEKMGLKEGGEYLVKLGLKAGEKAGQKAAEALALKAAVKGAEVGGTLAAQSAVAVSTGPAAPFVEAAMLAFDVLSMGLDLLDGLIPGGTVGYSKMGTIQQYQEMRDGIMKEMKKAFQAQGSKFPSVVGPLDKLSSDEYKVKLSEQVKFIMDSSKNPVDPLIKPMLDKIIEDVNSKKLSAADTDDDSKMEIYLKLIDMDKVTQKATDNLCIILNGKNVDIGDGKMMCSYPDRNTCETSYTWPLKEDSNETYAEFKNNLYGGSCVTASYALRGICQSNNLPYDSETGICKIDENYCKSKGADWIYNDNIKAYDCGINSGQNIAELLFGTTITRGLKQIFDPNQYEKCKPGEFNNVYSCSGCNEGEEVNNDLNIAAAVLTGGAGAATLGTLGGLNMCYPKCKSGFHPFGANICSPDCELGWTDDGAFCRKAGVCEDNTDHMGALCYPKCKSGFHPFGTNICSPDCEPGWTDDGAFCRKAGVCEDNMDHNGALCYPKCNSGFHPFGSNICSPDCEPGWTDDGATCRKAGVCEDNMDHNGALCYPKCKSGFHPFGSNICSPDCEPGWTDDGATCRKAGVCEDNMDHNGALCYPKCNPGYNGNGPLCWENCPDGFTDTGAFCSKGGDVYPKMSRPADKKGCDGGQRDDNISCWVDAYGRGIGRFRDTSCPDGWRNDGITCWEPLGGGGCRGGDCKTVDNGYNNLSWGAAGCNGPKQRETKLFGGHTGWDDCYSTHIVKLETSCSPIVCDPVTGGKTKPVDFSCHGDEDMNGLLCYPKCKSGFHAEGCCTCAPDGHVGGYIAKDLGSRLSCHDDENNIAGVCLKKCNDGYHDDGLFCRKDIQTITKKSYGRSVGVPDTVIKAKPNTSYGRGVGVPDTVIKAKPNTSYGRGVGVPDTIIKAKPDTSYGRGVGVPDTIIKAKPNTAYGRGVGHIANTRIKKRIASYSTKDN